MSWMETGWNLPERSLEEEEEDKEEDEDEDEDDSEEEDLVVELISLGMMP